LGVRSTCSERKGETTLTELYQLSGTAIKRHKKIKGAYNPFDPEWEMYGEQLQQERMLENMRHRKQFIRMYIDQKGLCAICSCKMTKTTGWHDHHIEYRVHGGSDALEIGYYCTPIVTPKYIALV
jgi:RNA-directed DNA polymerase